MVKLIGNGPEEQ